MPPRMDLIGQRFGRYLVIGPRLSLPSGNVSWVCRCDCGTVRAVGHGGLRNGTSMSCGCARDEETAARNHRHGSARHGQVTVEYRVWLKMRIRCRNPTSKDYANYGGRGITICERWDDFAAFLADVGPRPSAKHSIERLDVNSGYAPTNVVWATRRAQANNTRRNRRLTLDGVTRTMAEWGQVTGISQYAIKQRLDKLGWSVERALTEPTGAAQDRSLTYDGRTLNLTEWGRITGLGDRTIGRRLKRGWSVERVLTEPVAGTRRPVA